MLDPWTDDIGPISPSFDMPKGNVNDDTGGGYSSGWNFINPMTGQVDPSYRPAPGTTDRLGQTGTPTGGKAGGGGPGGAGIPGGGGSGNGIVDTYMGTGAAPAAGAAGATTAGTAAGIFGSSLKWGDIINAALAIYGLHKASEAPKFYPVPPTPAETYRLDKTKSLYDFASSYTEQYLKGLGNMNPDFHMPNSLTGNPAFMGGVKVPTFDASKAPSMSGAAPSNPAASIPPGITPERVRVDPATGRWSIDGATPEEQAWLDAANSAKVSAPPGAP